MRILHVYKDYHPILGGIENHVRTLAELQAGAGHEVIVLVTNPGRQPARQQLNGVTVIRAPRLATVASTPLSPTFPWQLRRLRPDITHLHFPYPVGELSQWLAGRRRPYVITYHADVVRQQRVLRLYRPLLNRVLRGAARILPTSAQYAATSPFLQPVAARCTVIPLSVDPARFAGAGALLPAVAVPTLLFVGRHRYYKGLDALLHALPGLEARLLVGGSGPMQPAWQKLSRHLGLAEQVHFLGDVGDPDLPRLYASADIFVLPASSRAEAFGMVLLEAMASGLPCITTEVGSGTSYVVQHEETGLVVPARDPAALRAALQRLLPDASLRRQMGAAGRARVLAEFTPQQLLARVQAVYEGIVSL